MKNKLLSILLFSTVVALSGCEQGQTTTEFELVNQSTAIEAYRMEKSEGKKGTIIETSTGLSQIILSSLLRTDLLLNADFLSPSDTKDYFEIAKATGMNTIELSLMWSEIEKHYDEYNFDDLKCYLDFAKEFNLKINLEWYGSLTDGEYHSVNVPKYINNHPEIYPVIKEMFDFANYGECKIMDWSNQALLAREQKAIYETMNYVYDWSIENQYNPIIMVQIGQGADRFQRWRVDAYNILNSEGVKFNQEEGWNMVNTYLNAVAKGVKYSKYKALTRVEFCEQSAVSNYVRNIRNLEYVDVVSPTYLHEIGSTKSGIKAFTDEYEDMPVINAENWASDINYRQILATFAMGGDGYVSYQLSCPNYYPESPNGALYGRLNKDGNTLEEKFVQRGTRASDTKEINDALSKAFVPVSSTSRSNFAAFGLNNLINSKDLPSERIQKVYLNNGLLLDYSNPKDSFGYAIYSNNYLYCFASKNSTLEINNCTVPSATKGYFNNLGEWVNEGLVTLEDNKVLTLDKDVVYRVRINNIQELPSIEELNAGNYKTVIDGIRG